jgi:hypothetical protein
MVEQLFKIENGQHQHAQHAIGAVDQREALFFTQLNRADASFGQKLWHWALDTVIVLFAFIFLATAFLLGQTGAVVVSSELIAFTLLMLQFVYTFSVCVRNVPPELPRRVVSRWLCFLSSFAMLAPFLLVDNW